MMEEEYRKEAKRYDRMQEEMKKHRVNYIQSNREALAVEDYAVQNRMNLFVKHKKLNYAISDAVLRKALGDDFSRKYKIFLTHKWDILKNFKKNLLD